MTQMYTFMSAQVLTDGIIKIYEPYITIGTYFTRTIWKFSMKQLKV